MGMVFMPTPLLLNPRGHRSVPTLPGYFKEGMYPVDWGGKMDMRESKEFGE
jgi:hypothetical protein